MGEPGVSIQELAATALSVHTAATAVPVFIGLFQPKSSDSLYEGQCIKINDWLAFDTDLASTVPDTTWVTLPAHKKIKTSSKTRTKGAPIAGLSITPDTCSVFEGEPLTFTITLPNAEEAQQLFLWLWEPDTGYGQQPAQITCFPSKETRTVSFKKVADDTVPVATVSLPIGTSSITLSLDTVCDCDTDPENFYLNVKLATPPEDDSLSSDWNAQCCVTLLPMGGVKVTPPIVLSYYAIQHYFHNGGGPCYLLQLDSSRLDALPGTIQTDAPDATLLVCAETNESLGSISKADIYSALTTLQQSYPGYFLIADNPDTNATVSGPYSAQTASYYPALHVRYRTRPADSDISIVGYSNAESNSVHTLADLKTVNPGAYTLISDTLDAPLTLPASAAVAGAYCAVDRERGVWKAPANVALRGVHMPTVILTDAEQLTMNMNGINAIRTFSDRGTLIWGARTLENNDTWRYIPVRRLFNSVERDIQNMLRRVVFEPNNQTTWERVRGAIDNYLRGLWRQGALLGNSDKEAYFVHVGKDLTMTEDDILQGKLIVQVGMAAVRPAEFIILQFTQNVGQR